MAPVNAKHQEKYCLTGQYINCPVYKRTAVQRIPTRVADAQVIARRRRFLLTVVLMTVVFSVVAVAVVLLRQNPGLMAAPTTQAAGLQEEPTLVNATATPTRTLSPTKVETATLPSGFRPFLPTTDLTRQACPKPEGWVSYYYKAGDSLALLGNYFGIPPQVLLEANCLSSPAQLSTGDRIYVPIATITPTPSITYTPTVTITHRPFIPPTATQGDEPPPPTSVPPTPVPPTDTPIIPTIPS